jgi:hypothetical protein
MKSLPVRAKNLEINEIMYGGMLPIEYVHMHLSNKEKSEWLSKVLTKKVKFERPKRYGIHETRLMSNIVHYNMRILFSNISNAEMVTVDGCWVLTVAGIIVAYPGMGRRKHISKLFDMVASYTEVTGDGGVITAVANFMANGDHDGLSDYRLCVKLTEHLKELRSATKCIREAHG